LDLEEASLALIYAQKLKIKLLKILNLMNEDVIIKEITTKGDEVQDIRLSEVGGKGLFSSNIEKELQIKKLILQFMH
jgi:hydroxymethylbilane synthase